MLGFKDWKDWNWLDQTEGKDGPMSAFPRYPQGGTNLQSGFSNLWGFLRSQIVRPSIESEKAVFNPQSRVLNPQFLIIDPRSSILSLQSSILSQQVFCKKFCRNIHIHQKSEKKAFCLQECQKNAVQKLCFCSKKSICGILVANVMKISTYALWG